MAKMKKMFLIVFLSLMVSTNVYADSVFDKLLSAMKGNATDAQLVALEKRYKGWVIDGEGYVDDVRSATFTTGVTIHLSEKHSEWTIFSDVMIIVPQDSPYLSRARNLNKGQKISFSGKFDDIFSRQIYIKGNVEISPR